MISGVGPAVRFYLVCLSLAALGCGDGTTRSPFEVDAGAGGSGGNAPDAAPPLQPPVLGAPCGEDFECDDGIECTQARCDPVVGRCRITPLHERCADDVYCNGVEQCQPGVGCVPGEPVSCGDSTTCTIDRCVEETRSCEHRARDADGDGDPVWNCGGTDCDDTDPRVNGLVAEICGNGVDDNCDGVVDEEECESPEHDTCADPLLVDQSGTYALSLSAAAEDMTLSCVESGGTRRDVVVALSVPEGPALDVDVVAVAARSIALAAATECADPSSEFVCVPGVEHSGRRGSVARAILRDLEPGTYPLFVSGIADDSVSLAVSYGTALPVPSNDTCDSAVWLTPGTKVETTLASASRDLESHCGAPLAEVVFRFELEETQDVELSAAPLDDFGDATLSLRDERCVPIASELTCRSGAPVSLFARALAPGTYFVAVGATGPSDLAVRLSLSAPSEAPPGEGCESPPVLVPGETQSAELSRRVDAVHSQCLVGAVEASYSLTLSEPSDVLLVERISNGDTGAANLLPLGCAPGRSLACRTGTASPIRARAYGVPPGEYRAVAESRLGSPLTLTAFVRPSVPGVLVGLSDSCDDAVLIPETGGRFSGNTSNAFPDFEASCDFGGSFVGGAPDQLLKLRLAGPRRVVLDMAGSHYDTLLVVRRATGCPGPELPNACAPGHSVSAGDEASRSYLDLALQAGEYWVQIDGFDRAAGAWVLDVFTSEP